MDKRSLLLVDGDARSLRVLEVSLKKAGFTVTTAVSGRDALEKVRTSPPDLIISDTDMGEMNGFDFCRLLKDTPEWSAIPFIFLTNQTGIESKIRGLELGVEDYLTKPIYIKEILTRVRILLQKRERANLEEKKEGTTRFVGSLSDMGVVDLIQTIEVSRKTGLIHFAGVHRESATLYFRDGKIIDAETGHLVAEDAVYRLLTWTEGVFEVLFRSVRRKDVIRMSSQGLLMEGMRRLDEWGRLCEQLPKLDSRFEVDYDELWDRLPDLPDDLNPILRLFDGRRTLMDVVDRSGYGDLECIEVIAKLYFEGIIVERTDSHAPPMRTSTAELVDQAIGSAMPAESAEEVGADGGNGAPVAGGVADLRRAAAAAQRREARVSSSPEAPAAPALTEDADEASWAGTFDIEDGAGKTPGGSEIEDVLIGGEPTGDSGEHAMPAPYSPPDDEPEPTEPEARMTAPVAGVPLARIARAMPAVSAVPDSSPRLARAARAMASVEPSQVDPIDTVVDDVEDPLAGGSALSRFDAELAEEAGEDAFESLSDSAEPDSAEEDAVSAEADASGEERESEASDASGEYLEPAVSSEVDEPEPEAPVAADADALEPVDAEELEPVSQPTPSPVRAANGAPRPRSISGELDRSAVPKPISDDTPRPRRVPPARGDGPRRTVRGIAVAGNVRLTREEDAVSGEFESPRPGTDQYVAPRVISSQGAEIATVSGEVALAAMMARGTTERQMVTISPTRTVVAEDAEDLPVRDDSEHEEVPPAPRAARARAREVPRAATRRVRQGRAGLVILAAAVSLSLLLIASRVMRSDDSNDTRVAGETAMPADAAVVGRTPPVPPDRPPTATPDAAPAIARTDASPRPTEPPPEPPKPPDAGPKTPRESPPPKTPHETPPAEPTAEELYASAKRALRRGDRDEALALIEQSLALESSGKAMMLKADIYEAMGQRDQAVATLDVATRRSSKSARLWKKKGLLHWELEQYDQARQSLLRYLELSPNASDAEDIQALIDSR